MKNVTKMFDGIRKGDLVTLNTAHASYVGIWDGIEKVGFSYRFIHLVDPSGATSPLNTTGCVEAAENVPCHVREAMVDPDDVISVFYESELIWI